MDTYITILLGIEINIFVIGMIVGPLGNAMTVLVLGWCQFVMKATLCLSPHGSLGDMEAPMPMVGHAICAVEMQLCRMKSGSQEDTVVSYVALTAVWTAWQLGKRKVHPLQKRWRWRWRILTRRK